MITAALFVFFCLGFVVVVVVVVLLFRAAPAAYGGSQARGLIGAVATGLLQSHSNAGSELSRVCDLHHSLQQRRVLNPRREAKDQTRNLMVPSRIH